MSNYQNYTSASVYINGNLLTEESKVEVKRVDGGQTVKTVAKGVAGRSPGAGMTNISVTNAVPSSDFELDPGPFMVANEPVEITVFAAGRTFTVEGSITDDNFSHGVDSVAELSFNFEGGIQLWQ